MKNDAIALGDFLRRELAAIPIECWGFFFPCHVAVWRFLSARYPKLLGELDAGYDGAPWFRRRGSEWFTSVLSEDPDYLSALEAVMYPVVEALPPKASDRGFLEAHEVPSVDSQLLETLVECIDRAVSLHSPPYSV